MALLFFSFVALSWAALYVFTDRSIRTQLLTERLIDAMKAEAAPMPRPMLPSSVTVQEPVYLVRNTRRVPVVAEPAL